MADGLANKDIRYVVRLPQNLRDALAELAERETRSLNGQIVHMLREGLPPDLKSRVSDDPRL